jgi:hypothetical protein
MGDGRHKGLAGVPQRHQADGYEDHGQQELLDAEGHFSPPLFVGMFVCRKLPGADFVTKRSHRAADFVFQVGVLFDEPRHVAASDA